MPVILATQEAEIRRMAVQRQPQANSSRDPISKKPFTEKGWWSDSRSLRSSPSTEKKKEKKRNLNLMSLGSIQES
jgi:hypothetical protein